MSDSPLAPRTLRGALVGMNTFGLVTTVVQFQYNPDTMTRRVEARASGSEDAERSEALRLAGPPRETITLSVEFDEKDDPLMSQGTGLGITPPLAALELFLYPTVGSVIANMALAQLGSIEIVPPQAPLTLLVWGPGRVLPVRLTDLSITEEQFDTLLNPTRATVELSLSVLSYHDLPITNPGHAYFLAHQIAKKTAAILYPAGNAGTLGVDLPF